MVVLLVCSVQALSGQYPFGFAWFLHQFETNELDREMLKVLIGSVTGLVVTLSMVAHKVCAFNCFSTDERSSKLLTTER